MSKNIIQGKTRLDGDREHFGLINSDRQSLSCGHTLSDSLNGRVPHTTTTYGSLPDKTDRQDKRKIEGCNN